MAFTALIVDDEPPARKRVADLLRDEPDIQVVGHCADGIEAKEALAKQRVDILFLDIQMPGAGGFEVVQAMTDGFEPAIIFVTASSAHALQAFGVDAIDYLLKPYSKVRFRQALAKARSFLEGRQPQPATSGAQPTRRLLVKDGPRVIFLKPEEVDWVEAEGNYVRLHVGSSRYLMRATMGSLEEHLALDFLKVSRSALVNAERIREIQAIGGGNHVVLLHGGQRVAMTRSLSELQAQLGGRVF